jgi:RNA-binding protein 39
MSDTDMPDAMKVEALLEEAAKEMEDKTATEAHRASQSGDDAPRGSENRDRDRARRDGRPSDSHRRDRSRDRSHRESNNGERHRSRDTDEGDDRISSRRHDRSRERARGGRGDRDGRRGDFYSGSGRARSRSPRREGDRYRGGRDHGRDRSRDRRPRVEDDRRGSGARRNPTPPEEPTEDDRDKRTIFVQQISARAETRHLRQFFESHCGAVVEAQIVKDRVTGRSKGYVLFSPSCSEFVRSSRSGGCSQ